MRIISILLLSLSLYSTASATDTVYKSIDDKGNITYSNSPPENSEQATSIDIAPQPSDKDIKAARQRHERNKEAASILDENRKRRDEMTAEENRLKRENQKQLQQQRQAEKNNDNNDYGYPYIPRRRPGGILPPEHRPVNRPVHLPAR